MSRVPTARSATGQHRQGSSRGGGSRASRPAGRGGNSAPGGGPVSRADGTRGIDRTGGTKGNERLTAMTGAVLLALFAAEGVTILSLHRLLTLHFFVGMLVTGPVLLKIGSTGYRFARYYTGSIPYVRKGPPAPLLRLLGPVVVLTSCGVIGSGIMLAFIGPRPGPWLFLHKALFVLWFGAMSIHVLAYAPRLARLVTAGGRGAARVQGSMARWLLLAAALGVGLILAVLTIHLAGSWSGSGPAGAIVPVA
jgi:hypothetical protein